MILFIREDMYKYLGLDKNPTTIVEKKGYTKDLIENLRSDHVHLTRYIFETEIKTHDLILDLELKTTVVGRPIPNNCTLSSYMVYGSDILFVVIGCGLDSLRKTKQESVKLSQEILEKGGNVYPSILEHLVEKSFKGE